jgi:hypothetical protein
MLIERYDLEVFTPPCDPGAERYAARARLTMDISEVLPYLNATLRGAVYLKEANALTWKKGGHDIAFHDYEIAASNVEDGQPHLGAPCRDRARLSGASTPDSDGGLQTASEYKLQAMRRTDLLHLCL